MLKVNRFINQLMSSNCYIVEDEESKHCFCIDPASEKSEREIEYIEQNGLTLDYVFLTHEHTDHTWGVNALIEKHPTCKVVCTQLCKEALAKEAKAYFQFYYDNPNYSYNVERIDFTTEDLDWHLIWSGHHIVFMSTPGHSPGSICIAIENVLFGGDTLMPFKPFIKKRSGGSMNQLYASLKNVEQMYAPTTIVYPGHGESGALVDMIKILRNYE